MLKPAKTREQLIALGIFLLGWLVPEWFKKQSDGPSIRTRFLRFILGARKGYPPAYIHDYDYYLRDIQWEPGTPKWIGARMEADARLKDNRETVALKHPWIGKIQGNIWFRGVRAGGASGGAVKALDELVVPPSLEDIAVVESHLNVPITKRARKLLKSWRVLRS